MIFELNEVLFAQGCLIDTNGTHAELILVRIWCLFWYVFGAYFRTQLELIFVRNWCLFSYVLGAYFSTFSVLISVRSWCLFWYAIGTLGKAATPCFERPNPQ